MPGICRIGYSVMGSTTYQATIEENRAIKPVMTPPMDGTA